MKKSKNFSKGMIFFRKSWIITLVVGISLGIFGIVKIVLASQMYVPPMGESGWFEAQSAHDNAEMLGIILTFVGFAFVALGGSLTLYFVSHMTPEDDARETAKAINNEKRYKNELKRLGLNDEEMRETLREADEERPAAAVSEGPKFCTYCGAKLNGKSKCPGCGSRAEK